MTLSAIKALLVAAKHGDASNADLAINAAAMLTDHVIASDAVDVTQSEAHGLVFTPDVSGDWPALLADVGSALDTIGATLTDWDPKLEQTFIESPSSAKNVDVPVASIKDEPVVEFAPTATRKIDPRAALNSMLFTVVKTNSEAFGIVVDVTTGGNQGWTTPAGLNTDYTLLNSARAAPGAWVIRVDLPNKTIIVSPTADIPAASLIATGTVELATAAEGDTGTDTARVPAVDVVVGLINQPHTRTVSDTTGTFVNADVGGLVLATGAGACAMTLNALTAPRTGRFLMLTLQATGAVTAVTVLIGTGSPTIDGAASTLTATVGRSRVSLISIDGQAWYTGTP